MVQFINIPLYGTSTAELRNIFKNNCDDFLFLNIGEKQISLEGDAQKKFINRAIESGAAIVYSDHCKESEGKIIPNPVIDIQTGSVRDDFDFGSIVCISPQAMKDYLSTCQKEYFIGGFYQFRLFAQRNFPIVRIAEMLYTVKETDNRTSGQKQFDYVNPRNRDSQIEMEQICTEHLMAIGAYLTPDCFKKVNFSNSYNIEASVIIPVKNRERTIADAINSVLKQQTGFPFNLIIVDNHSTDETVQWLREQQDIRLILNNENYGVAKGYKQGINISKGENILLLNNDVIVTPNWLYNLDTALWSKSEVGAVGCLSNYVSNRQKIHVNYQDITSMLDFAKNFNVQDSRKYELRDKLIGFCFLVKREVVEKVGLLDEQFFPGNFEDDDYCMRISKANYKCVLCKDTFVHHFGSIYFKENNMDYKKILKENKIEFNEKWNKK